MRNRMLLFALVLLSFAAFAQQSAAPPAQSSTPAAAAPAPPPYTPQYKGDPAHSQDEAIALGYMHTLIYAERLYMKKHAHYAPSLYSLAGSGSFTRRMIDRQQGNYTVSFRGGPKNFDVQLTPNQFDAQHRGFWANQTGIIHVAADQPATAESPVLKADSGD